MPAILHRRAASSHVRWDEQAWRWDEVDWGASPCIYGSVEIAAVGAHAPLPHWRLFRFRVIFARAALELRLRER
jgi:hypothetical protein